MDEKELSAQCWQLPGFDYRSFYYIEFFWHKWHGYGNPALLQLPVRDPMLVAEFADLDVRIGTEHHDLELFLRCPLFPVVHEVSLGIDWKTSLIY